MSSYDKLKRDQLGNFPEDVKQNAVLRGIPCRSLAGLRPADVIYQVSGNLMTFEKVQMDLGETGESWERFM
jgi:hypothetical protein